MNGLPDDSFSVRIHAGEPVAQTDELFGDTLQLLQWLGMLKRKEPVIITKGVKELIAKDMQDKRTEQLLALTVPEEQFLISLFDILNKHYADNEFSAENYAQILTMSKSQMYRRVTALTGYSPNDLLKEYRLEKAKELLRKKKHNVFEVALETGFTSASYFTKCFKTKFGLLPLAYQQLV